MGVKLRRFNLIITVGVTVKVKISVTRGITVAVTICVRCSHIIGDGQGHASGQRQVVTSVALDAPAEDELVDVDDVEIAPNFFQLLVGFVRQKLETMTCKDSLTLTIVKITTTMKQDKFVCPHFTYMTTIERLCITIKTYTATETFPGSIISSKSSSIILV